MAMQQMLIRQMYYEHYAKIYCVCGMNVYACVCEVFEWCGPSAWLHLRFPYVHGITVLL